MSVKGAAWLSLSCTADQKSTAVLALRSNSVVWDREIDRFWGRGKSQEITANKLFSFSFHLPPPICHNLNSLNIRNIYFTCRLSQLHMKNTNLICKRKVASIQNFFLLAPLIKPWKQSRVSLASFWMETSKEYQGLPTQRQAMAKPPLNNPIAVTWQEKNPPSPKKKQPLIGLDSTSFSTNETKEDKKATLETIGSELLEAVAVVRRGIRWECKRDPTHSKWPPVFTGFKLAFNYLKAKRYVDAINICHKVNFNSTCENIRQ